MCILYKEVKYGKEQQVGEQYVYILTDESEQNWKPS
jgi:hypothetical protein